MVKNKVVRNASWIIAFKLAQSVLNLFVGMMSARFLGPSNYGLINYAGSFVAFFVPVMRLGLNSIMVREISVSQNEEGKVLGTALAMNIRSGLLCIITIMIMVSTINRGEIETIVVCVLYSFTLLFQAIETIQYWFQANLMSKYSSAATFTAYFFSAFYKILILVFRKGVYWFAIVNVIEHFITAILLLFMCKKLSHINFAVSLETASRLISRSKYFIIASMMVVVLQQTDKLMLKAIMDETAIGHYSSAVTCAGIFGFVYAAIIDSANPMIIGYKNKGNEEKYVESLAMLYSIIFYLSVAQCVFTTAFSEEIIFLLYGQAYMPAAKALQICVWYVTYAYFGTIRHIWILAEGKYRHIIAIDMFTAVSNVIINLLLIPHLGIMGAAIASLLAQFSSNFIFGAIYTPIKENHKIMIKGINPKYRLDFINRYIFKNRKKIN